MIEITIPWIALPFLVGFTVYLLPKLTGFLALFLALLSAGYGVQIFLQLSPINVQLPNKFGVTLIIDQCEKIR